DVGQVVEREADHLGPPGAERPAIVAVPPDLEVEQPDLVARRRERRSDPLDPERLEPEIDLGEEERARVHEKDAHGSLLSGGELSGGPRFYFEADDGHKMGLTAPFWLGAPSVLRRARDGLPHRPRRGRHFHRPGLRWPA